MFRNKQTKRGTQKKPVYVAILVLSFLLVAIQPALAQDDPPMDDPVLQEEFRMPGTVEGIGTTFEITDSEYLNITLESSEPVQVRLESVPEMVTMYIEATTDTVSLTPILTFSGFTSSTTYYKYEDDYHNEVPITTDEDGCYTYTQDLSEPHLVFIQPRSSTIFIPADTSIGTWDPDTRNYTLNTDVNETIQVDEDNLTLDGNGHTVNGTGTGNGIYLYGRTGVAVKNIIVQGFSKGIYLGSSSNNTLTGNTALGNYAGIRLYHSSSNTLTGNTASNNDYSGIWLRYSSNNTLTGNTASNNYYHGIYLRYSSNNTLTGNTMSNNNYLGIWLSNSGNNTLSGNTMSGNLYNFSATGTQYAHFDNHIDTSNTVDGRPIYYVKNAVGDVYDSGTNAGVFYAINCDSITVKDLNVTRNHNGVFFYDTHNSTIENVIVENNWHGIWLRYSSSNTLTGNTASNNEYGIYLSNSSSNTLTGNTTLYNEWGIYLYLSSNNTLTGNTASNNYVGIRPYDSSNNILTGNTASNNRYGIYLSSSSNDNQIYNNNFIDNQAQARVDNSTGNIFNLDKPVGGNYWSDWTTPDEDGDGFVDFPYVFQGGQDNLPLTNQFVGNQPPVADAGDNIQIASAAQVYTVVQGMATDPDGDPLEYRWLEGETIILDWSPVGPNGEAYLGLALLPYFSIGDHTLKLEVSDGKVAASDDMILTIQNSPPEVQPAPSYQVVEIGIDPIVVVADVSDFDGDTLSYEWLKNSNVLASGTVETVQGGEAVPLPDLNIPAGDPRFPVGVHVIELRVSDGVNDPVGTSVSAEVTDTTAPSISPIPTATMLWIPNHKLNSVTIQANAFDNGGGAIHLEVEVLSSDPPDADGDGNTIPDYYIDSVDDETGVIELRLRAERAGSGDGRTYTIIITATDESGNVSVAIVEIFAPHDRRKM